MNSQPESIRWKKDTLVLIKKLRAEVSALQSRTSNVVAVVGAACKFPKASDVEGYWRLLDGGVDAITEVPAERFDVDAYYDPDPDALGKMTTRFGGFTDQIDQFDPAFFGISPREAVSLDPQQRILLETAWQALEQAGIDAQGLRGSATGVFVGVSEIDYAQQTMQDLTRLDAYAGLGNGQAFVAGRLAYTLGLQGPVESIDTVCSSSLVALHQARRALLAGECELALAGGVHVMLSPHIFVFLSRSRALSADGRCKAFDASADGFSRAEGCGVVVLKRLRDAERDGDRILAVIRGSAVNHDGPSSGLTVPNGPSQERVIANALREAGVSPSEVAYLEAHGTGTSLGDPIEVQAAAKVLGEGRDPDKPLLLGSVKTNLGHLEATAGVAGLIKVVLAMQHGIIPKQLHFREPNPHIPWDRLPVQVVTESTAWPEGRRIAGVSSFGMSGTNAHVVLEAYESENPMVVGGGEALRDGGVLPERRAHLLALSGKNEAGLRALAERYREWVAAHANAALADVCFTAGAGRSHFEQRASVVVESREQLTEALQKLASGTAAGDVHVGYARQRPKVALLFTGQGSQYAGMAEALYETQPVFRQTLDRCAELLKDKLDEQLLEVIFEGAGGLLDQTRWTQPALFALEVALYETYRSLGLEADVVLGHSVGEYAAAYVAGILTLEDGLKLIAKRGELFGALPASGSMAAIFADAAPVQAAVDEVNANSPSSVGLSIAAHNGAHVVVSGPAERVEQIVGRFETEGVRCAPLATSHAFHSALLEPALEAFEPFAATIEHWPAERTLISNLTGAPLASGQILDAAYWRRHAREPVQFGQSVVALAEAGVEVLLELGPQPTLTAMALHCWAGEGPPVAMAALRRGVPADRSLLESIARLYAAGCRIDFAALDAGYPRSKLSLPTYPFQRQRYWVDAPKQPVLPGESVHPLLGEKLELASTQQTVYHQQISLISHPWIGDHRVYDMAVIPGVSYAAMVMAAVGVPAALEDVSFQEPLFLAEPNAVREAELVIEPVDEGGLRHIEVYSRVVGQDEWRRHAVLMLRDDPPSLAPLTVDLANLRERLQPINTETLTDAYASVSLAYGPMLQAVRQAWIGDEIALSEIEVPEALASQLAGEPIHPVLVDACARLTADLWDFSDEPGVFWAPWRVEGMQLMRPAPRRFFAYVNQPTRVDEQLQTLAYDIQLLDEAGQAFGRIDGFTLKRAPRDAFLRRLQQTSDRLLYTIRWQKASESTATEDSSGVWLLLGNAQSTLPLAEQLEARGQLVERGAVQELAALLDAVMDKERQNGNTPLAGVVLVGGQNGDAASDAYANVKAVLQAAQPLLARGVSLPRSLTLLTQSAIAVDAAEAVQPGQSALWGLGRTLQAEQPQLNVRLLDVEHIEAESLAGVLLAEGESQQVLRGGQVFTPRLTRARLESMASLTIRADASYLITGGLGALGLATCAWLVERGAGHVVLTSRREPDEAARERIAAIEAVHDGTVVVCSADVADAGQIQALMARFGREWSKLAGVIHAAGVLDDGVITEQTAERFEQVMRPKVLGAWNLHRATQDRALDFFVLYSSVASALGSAGQGNYAAANAFLDGLAQYRRALGLAATSINWGPWAEGGMASSAGVRAQLAKQGITPLKPSEAHQALAELLASGVASGVVLDADWQRMSKWLGEARPALLSALLSKPAPGSAKQVSEQERRGFLQQLEEAPASHRKEALMAYVQEQVIKVLMLAPSTRLDPKRLLNELGLDSLMSIELKNRFMSELGVHVPIKELIVGISIAQLVELLLDRLTLSSLALSEHPLSDMAEYMEEITL